MAAAKNKNTAVFFQALVIATVAEFAGLFFWVNQADKGNFFFGIVIVLAGLLAERISVYMLIHTVWGPNPPHKNLVLNLVVAGIGETIAWLLWLYLADGPLGLLWASVLLGVVLLFEHSIQIGFFMQINFFKHVTDPMTIVFSALEGVVAFFWLYFVRNDHIILGMIVLLVGLTVEHIIQGSVIGTEPPKAHKAKHKPRRNTPLP
ncbi:MAG TPA: hypothetical protein VJY62_06490 [Bacteroidia bacterium]|nr:hypothetical protein [Bacteroidia bacterium]